jgi:Putative GTPase activating protein for Arf
MDPKVFIDIQKLPGNKFCVDCGTKEPDWGVPGMGILVCIQCSGKHRYVQSTRRLIDVISYDQTY